MAFIKEIKENVPLWARAIVASIFFMCLFWPPILYHYSKQLFELSDLKFSAIVVGFATLWYFLQFVKGYMIIDIIKQVLNNYEDNPRDEDTTTSIKFWIIIFADGAFYFWLISIISVFATSSLKNFVLLNFSIQALLTGYAIVAYFYYKRREAQMAEIDRKIKELIESYSMDQLLSQAQE